MPPPAPEPAARAPLDAASLGREARDRLHRLLGQLHQNYVETETAAARLAQRTEDNVAQQLQGLRHRYGVFLVGDPARPMVLRDIDKLDGQDPIAPATDDFAAALRLANAQLRTGVSNDSSSFADADLAFDRALRAAKANLTGGLAPQVSPPNVAGDLAHLQTLIARLEKIALPSAGSGAAPARPAPLPPI